MRSSDGRYFPALDHVRALAAFMVFSWHFVHPNVPTKDVPSFFLFSLFEEGYIGVALFLVLSGYLFMKITDDRKILYFPFLWNRFIRLAPLLLFLLVWCAIFLNYDITKIFHGLMGNPRWPLVAWTIAIEIQFYIVFPILIIMFRRLGSSVFIFGIILAICVRYWIWEKYGSVQTFSYWTMYGRADQFLAGMLFYTISKNSWFRRRSVPILIAVILSYSGFWHYFNLQGGFFHFPKYASPSPLWIIIPTIHGIAFGALIAAYEVSGIHLPRLINSTLAKIGESSYSIYLLHFLMLPAIKDNIPSYNTFGVAFAYCIPAFLLVAALCRLTYLYFEVPFLRFRSTYLEPLKVGDSATGSIGLRRLQAKAPE